MLLKENVYEGLRTVQSNLLRSILTAAIEAIGITSLVGILTAIDGMQASISTVSAAWGPTLLPSGRKKKGAACSSKTGRKNI